MKNGNLDNEARISPICFDFFARFRSIGFKLIIKPAIYFVFLSRSIYHGCFDLDHGCFVPEPIGDGKRQRFGSGLHIYQLVCTYVWIISRQGPWLSGSLRRLTAKCVKTRQGWIPGFIILYRVQRLPAAKLAQQAAYFPPNAGLPCRAWRG